MNPIDEFVSNFRDLVAQVPEIVQPLVVLLAGAVPFIEGEGGAIIGVVGGVHPIVAAVAAAAGNFLCVVVVVLISSRARLAVVAHHESRARVAVGKAANPVSALSHASASSLGGQSVKPESNGRARFRRWLVRFGVPGASILAPLAIPTQITSAILAAGGTRRGWILLWQAIAITLWTTLATVSAWIALQVVTSVG